MPDTPTADSLLGSGAVTAPASGATIATVAIPQSTPAPPGVQPTQFYHVYVLTNQSGTIDTTHSAHLSLTHGTTTVGTMLSTGVANVIELDRVSPGADADISVKANATFAAGAIVAATLVVTRMD